MNALVEDGFAPEPMRRDERVVEHRYNEQDPVTVADELAAANAERWPATWKLRSGGTGSRR